MATDDTLKMEGVHTRVTKVEMVAAEKVDLQAQMDKMLGFLDKVVVMAVMVVAVVTVRMVEMEKMRLQQVEMVQMVVTVVLEEMVLMEPMAEMDIQETTQKWEKMAKEVLMVQNLSLP